MSSLLKKQIYWYPYEDSSMHNAKQENKYIFLFIDSSTSQWSKRMEENSFNNKSIIELINERFIPIRVKKDERPDIERYYHKIYTLMNRQNTSSPLSIFLTASLEPFYAGSYIPQEDIGDQLSLESLLRIISKKYITDYDTLVTKGQEVLSHINAQEQNIQATKLNLNIMNTVKQHAQSLLDTKYGGFSQTPKFPNTSTLELLFDVYELEKDVNTLNTITLTLDNMIIGGFYDLERGGFYHYSKNNSWSEPYKVKTTYDNALLILLYLRAYTITKKEKYKEVAFSTLDYMLKSRNKSKLFSLKDEEIITSWNALMLQALFLASNINEKYKVNAFESLEGLLSELYVSGTLYHTKKQKEKATIQAFLEDYATLGETLIMAYQNSLDESFLMMATQFSNLLIEQYYEQARWVYSTGKFKVKENIHDTTIVSSLSSALTLLLSISSLVDNNYKKFVFKTLELHSFNLMRQPLSSPKLTQIVLRYLKDDIIIQSNETLLKKHINDRVLLSYPYVYFKSIIEEEIKINNSHSTLKEVQIFEEVKHYMESL